VVCQLGYSNGGEKQFEGDVAQVLACAEVTRRDRSKCQSNHDKTGALRYIAFRELTFMEPSISKDPRRSSRHSARSQDL
jgi:hypothetical protein